MSPVDRLSALLGAEALKLLDTGGSKLIRDIGMETVRAVVLDVLSGKNLRDSTELLTRSRLATLNAAMVKMLIEGEKTEHGFIAELPKIAERILKGKKLSKSERWLAQWVLGLNDKASQNILRDDPTLLTNYRELYERVCADAIGKTIARYGLLDGYISLDDVKIVLNRQFIVYLLGIVGSQTLTIRGSEKSAYGKLFERLILGSLLSILEFSYTGRPEGVTYQREFWLSSQGEKRESDATALWEIGKGIRFDIGFIGSGNPEISLDKVTRFEREITLGRSKWFMATIVIVDRIGKNSSIQALANAVNGDIVQMSMAYWPQEVARVLEKRMGFEHPLTTMKPSEIRAYLETALENVSLEQFLPFE